MRILVFTVTSWNSKVGANTWESLLEQYRDRDDVEIYNLCIRDEIPDSSLCKKYFAVSEGKVIKSLLKRSIKTGREVEPNEQTEEDIRNLTEHNERYVKMSKNRRYSMLLVREMIWKLGKWHTKELDEFLDEADPDIILHAMEGYVHLNRIIKYAIKKTGAKAIGYLMDDNFTYKQSNKLGYKILRYFQKRSLKQLALLTQEFFAISPMTKQEADSTFGIDCAVLTKPLNRMPEFEEKSYSLPIKMLYTGNLLIGRDRSLLKLAKVLKSVNADEEKFTVDVYTGTYLSEDVLNELKYGFVTVHEAIGQQQVLEKQREADLLLFLEDVDGKDAKTARLSFSTKLTDYFSTGNAIFAIGNKETSPMKYLADNGAAFVAESEDQILANLEAILNDNDLLKKTAKNVCTCGKENHNPQIINELFNQTVMKVLSYKK